MKKILLGVTALTLCACLTACGTSQTDSAATNLSKGLDNTSNIIASMRSVNPSDISISNTSADEDLRATSEQTQQSLLDEQYYKAEILEKTAQIKKKLDGDVKLSSSQSTALNDLVDSLNKYSNLVKTSQGEMSGSARAVSTLKKSPLKNRERIGAKLNRLSCNSNLRSAYYENLIDTLDEIELCLNIDDQTQNIRSYEEEEIKQDSSDSADESRAQNDEEKTTDTKKHGLRKNIDTYRPKEQITRKRARKTNRFDRYNSDTYGPARRNIDTYRNPNYGTPYGNAPFGNNQYGYAPYAPYGNHPYANNQYGFYPNGMYGNRANSPAGGAYGSNDFNRAETPNAVIPVASETQIDEVRKNPKEELTHKKDNEIDEKSTQNEVKTESASTLSMSLRNTQKKHPKGPDDDPIVIAY